MNLTEAGTLELTDLEQSWGLELHCEADEADKTPEKGFNSTHGCTKTATHQVVASCNGKVMLACDGWVAWYLPKKNITCGYSKPVHKVADCWSVTKV